MHTNKRDHKFPRVVLVADACDGCDVFRYRAAYSDNRARTWHSDAVDNWRRRDRPLYTYTRPLHMDALPSSGRCSTHPLHVYIRSLSLTLLKNQWCKDVEYSINWTITFATRYAQAITIKLRDNDIAQRNAQCKEHRL